MGKLIYLFQYHYKSVFIIFFYLPVDAISDKSCYMIKMAFMVNGSAYNNVGVFAYINNDLSYCSFTEKRLQE